MGELTPRQRRRKKTKQAILQTAQQLIAENGAEGLSLREIARRIDYSPAGLYEYFKSKDEIVAAVVDEGFERLSTCLKRVPTDLPPGERLIELGMAYLAFARHHPEYFILIFTTLPTGEMPPGKLDQEGYSTFDILVEAVQTAIEVGEFKPPADYSLDEIAYTMWGLVHGLAMLQQTNFRHSQDKFGRLHRWAIEKYLKGLQTG